MTTLNGQDANIEPIDENSNSATEMPTMNNDETTKNNDTCVLGPLRSEAAMALHTREALTLFAGRPQQGDKVRRKDYSTNNLKKFAVKMNAIWYAAQGDDPFADWLLCIIEHLMEEASIHMAAEIAGLQDRLGLLKPQSTQSTEPVEIRLNFANPFPYRAASLIAQYDKLALMALAVCHTGQDGKEAKDVYIHAPAKRIRKLFMMADRWKLSGVTRASYDPVTADTRKAEAAMGKLPKAVLDATLRASIAPDIRKAKGLALPQPDG